MERKLTILAFVFGVLLVCFLIYNRSLNVHERGLSHKFLLPFKQDQIAAFEINNFTESFYFKKTDGSWELKRGPSLLAKSIAEKEENRDVLIPTEGSFQKADPVAVTKLLTPLLLLEVSEAIATSRDAAKTFQINPHSLHVIFFDGSGKQLARLNVGKQGPDLMSSFVQKDAENAVYLVEKNLPGLILQPFEAWLFKEQEKKQDEKVPQKD